MPLSEDPEKKARQLSNLIDPSEAGKLGGRPKGSRNWSSVTQALLDDEELFEQLVSNMERKPAWLKATNTKTLMQAITIAQGIKAMGGSHFSAEWLRKTGFGDKIDITSNGETLKIEPVVLSNIKPRNIVEAEIIVPKEVDDGSTA